MTTTLEFVTAGRSVEIGPGASLLLGLSLTMQWHHSGPEMNASNALEMRASISRVDSSALSYRLKHSIAASVCSEENKFDGQSVLDGPESLVRFGVAKRTELRFTVPDYFHNLEHWRRPRLGLRRLCRRSKRTAWPHAGWIRCIRVILFLSFPTGATAVSQRRVRSGI
jgi:hypothetical protein